MWMFSVGTLLVICRSQRPVFTFSLSVHSWMALGMSLAVFSFVMEQTSFNLTVSYTQDNKLNKPAAATSQHSIFTVYHSNSRARKTNFCAKLAAFPQTALLIQLCKNMAWENDALCDESNSSTHQRFPAEYVAIETDPVFGEVEATLQEDISLQGTGVVCQDEARGQRLRYTSLFHTYSTYCFQSHIKNIIGYH